MKKYIVLMIIGLICSICNGQNTNVHKEFALYLTKDSELKEQDIIKNKINIDDLILNDKPFISEDDIEYYDSQQSKIIVNSNSLILNKITFKLNRQIFVVCIGEERLYWGSFWSIIMSSLPSHYYIIRNYKLKNELNIKIGYKIERSVSENNSIINSEKILKRLKKIGKLKK